MALLYREETINTVTSKARGFEALLLGKDPRDASYVTSRFCGVCFSVHQMASVRALDAAFGAQVPWGRTLLRNLVMAALGWLYGQNHRVPL